MPNREQRCPLPVVSKRQHGKNISNQERVNKDVFISQKIYLHII